MTVRKRILLTGTLLLAFTALAFAGGQQESTESAPVPENPRIKLATTTSTENSGLLDELLPVFEDQSGYRVDVIAVGTGKAIAHGEAGDVDLIMVHARSREDAFVDAGYGVNRRDLMHNDFVILGPAEDPAGIKGGTGAAEALARIAEAEADFVSRGDDSGTHTKERSLWAAAEVEPAGKWYKEAGQGMGAVLTMTNDMGGYTMADRGTYLAMMDTLALEVLVEGDPALYNPYGVIAVNPQRHPHVNNQGAMAFIDFLTGETGQSIIRGYRRNGEVLFFPDVIE